MTPDNVISVRHPGDILQRMVAAVRPKAVTTAEPDRNDLFLSDPESRIRRVQPVLTGSAKPAWSAGLSTFLWFCVIWSCTDPTMHTSGPEIR